MEREAEAEDGEGSISKRKAVMLQELEFEEKASSGWQHLVCEDRNI